MPNMACSSALVNSNFTLPLTVSSSPCARRVDPDDDNHAISRRSSDRVPRVDIQSDDRVIFRGANANGESRNTLLGGKMSELRLTLDMIAKALGERSACRFADYFGGKRVRIPKAAHGPCALTRALGAKDARVLSEQFGGGAIEVPASSQYRRVQIARLRREGMRPAAIARQVACTQRYVCDVLAEQSYFATHRG